MGKNKQQAATEARTRKATPEVAEPAVAVEQPKPNGKADAKTIAAATPTKQDATIAKLKEGWTAKGVNLDKLTIKDDGKFKLLIVDAGWPTVRIGASGGVTVMELKSYPDAFTAAMEGLDRYTKQQAREAKQAAAAAPAVATKSAPPVAAPEVKTKAAA